MKSFVLLIVMLLFVAGCSTTFNKGIKLWCQGELPFFAELIQKNFPDPNDQARELMNAAGLHCFMDIDNGISAPDNPSQACKCDNAKNEQERIKECQKWVKEIQEKGGCYEEI